MLLEYDFIFKKGILFIRLKGEINEVTSKIISEEIDPLIEENGIKNVVFNLKEINNIDNKGIATIYECYNRLNERNSDIELCSIPCNLRSKFAFLLKYIKEREDEKTILTKI